MSAAFSSLSSTRGVVQGGRCAPLIQDLVDQALRDARRQGVSVAEFIRRVVALYVILCAT